MTKKSNNTKMNITSCDWFLILLLQLGVTIFSYEILYSQRVLIPYFVEGIKLSIILLVKNMEVLGVLVSILALAFTIHMYVTECKKKKVYSSLRCLYTIKKHIEKINWDVEDVAISAVSQSIGTQLYDDLSKMPVEAINVEYYCKRALLLGQSQSSTLNSMTDSIRVMKLKLEELRIHFPILSNFLFEIFNNIYGQSNFLLDPQVIMNRPTMKDLVFSTKMAKLPTQKEIVNGLFIDYLSFRKDKQIQEIMSEAYNIVNVVINRFLNTDLRILLKNSEMQKRKLIYSCTQVGSELDHTETAMIHLALIKDFLSMQDCEKIKCSEKMIFKLKQQVNQARG